MSRIIVPSVTDWLQSADINSGVMLVEGRLAEMLHPELWRDRVGAWSRALDCYPWDGSGSGNHGSFVDAVIARAEGWELFGSLNPGHIVVPDRDNLDFGTAALFSAAAWVRFDSPGLDCAIMAKGRRRRDELLEPDLRNGRRRSPLHHCDHRR